MGYFDVLSSKMALSFKFRAGNKEVIGIIISVAMITKFS